MSSGVYSDAFVKLDFFSAESSAIMLRLVISSSSCSSAARSLSLSRRTTISRTCSSLSFTGTMTALQLLNAFGRPPTMPRLHNAGMATHAGTPQNTKSSSAWMASASYACV